MITNASWLNRLKNIEVADATYSQKSDPLVMEKAYGEFIYDVSGRRYLDYCGGFGALSFGHTPHFAEDIFKRFMHATPDSPAPLLQGLGDLYPSTAKIQFAESLLQLLPKRFKRVSLAATGAQAVETALKSAILYTQGSSFIAFKGAYHGVDFGALKVTESPFFKEGLAPWIEGGNGVTCTWLPLNCPIGEIEKIVVADQVKARQNKIAGIIVEPIQGRAGIHFAEPDWLSGLTALAHKYDIPLIFDEIYCGMGRTGRISYSDEFPADIVCFGKALGAGMPISAVVGTEQIMSAWPENTGEARHTGTFFGHPLSALFALNVLQSLMNPSNLEKIHSLGETFHLKLKKLAERMPGTIKVRGRGLMQGIDFGKSGIGAIAMDRLRAQGVIGLAAGEKGECLMFTPAFTTTPVHIEQVILSLETIIPGLMNFD